MKLQRPSKNTIMLILIVSVVTLLFSSALSLWLSEVTYLRVPSIGIIKTIGVEAYWDETLEYKTEVIDWDVIRLGSSKNVTFYVRSISNVKTVLQFNVTNWNPTNISKYMNLSWNYYGTPIDPIEVIDVTITLTATYSMPFIDYLIANDVKEFSIDIVISAIE